MSDAVPTIEFVAPMPGFPDRRTFLLVRLDEGGYLYVLTSVDDPALKFIVAPPFVLFPDYAPEIDDETLDLLGVHDPDRLLLLIMIRLGESAQDATANLLAPIVVERDTGRAVQAVLTGSGLPVRAKLPMP